jgi:succinate dehydrogenase/fumarate reductase flavoprotein subunit
MGRLLPVNDARDVLTCDLLVIGAGMAGMTAAGRAAEKGTRVIVVEKAASIGGSAALSGGYLWTATSADQLGYYDNGDPRLHRVVVDTYPDLMAWLRRRGVHMEAPQAVLFGRGYQIDIIGHLRQCALEVEKAGGHVVRETRIAGLATSGRRVTGAIADHADGTVAIEAGHVLLATGGFQGSPELRAQYIHPAARDSYLRSNSDSVGDGLRLGIAAGGAHAGPNPGFYGHLIASPVHLEKPADFVSFTQYQSDHGILLNEAGRRFVDESRADHESTQHTLRQPGARALLVWDEWVQREVVLRPPVLGADPIDRFAVAIAAGARGARLERMAELQGFADGIGYDGTTALETLAAYDAAMAGWPEAICPARVMNARPLSEPPFYALEVRPGITFTFGGLAVDEHARALDPAGEPVPGLLVAGADAGNVYRAGYAGGLALAGTFGFRAAMQVGAA